MRPPGALHYRSARFRVPACPCGVARCPCAGAGFRLERARHSRTPGRSAPDLRRHGRRGGEPGHPTRARRMTGFLASIARRAARPGNRLVPKGVLPRVASKPDVEQEEEPVRSLHLARAAQEENEEARPLRRSAEMKPAKEEEVPPTQRAVHPTKEEEAAQALRRREAGSPRSEEEEPVQPLRRSVEAGPDVEREAAPMRRATNETEEEEAAQALRRAEAPPQPEETQEPPLSRT